MGRREQGRCTASLLVRPNRAELEQVKQIVARDNFVDDKEAVGSVQYCIASDKVGVDWQREMELSLGQFVGKKGRRQVVL